MENTEKFRMRKYSKKTATNIYAAPMRGVNENDLKINITPYGEKFDQLSYWDKIWNLEGYIFLKVFYHWGIIGWISGFLEITETSSEKHML